MSTRNIKTLRYLALFVAILSFGAIASGDASAASTFDTYTDGDGVVWDRETTDDGDIYIGVQSVPSGVTTITVPSMSAVASGKSTYFLDSICYYNGGCSSVVADTANVTKLDMTNTSGIQIKNVSHVFDTNHEVELIFGENVVIADPRGTNASGLVDNDYYPIGSGQSQNPYTGVDGAFEGMKIKLTGFDNVKYIGWNAFRNTELNQSNVDITIGDSQTIGAYVFAGSNVKSLSINLTEVSQGFCQNCASLESLTLGSNVQIIRASAFENTTALAQRLETSATRIYAQAFKGSAITGASLTSATAIDRESFMNTNLSTGVSFNTAGYSIGYMAFRNAGLSEVDLSAVLTIEAYGFADNSITEAYLPKSYRKYEVNGSSPYNIFENNPLKKITLAYDLARANSYMQPFYNQIGVNAMKSLEEIVLIAPYADSEPVASDHNYAAVNSDSYSMTLPNDVVQSLKNVIPRLFFYVGSDGADGEHSKKIVIDDNYEMIGCHSFGDMNINAIHTINNGVESEDNRLPSKLRVIGSLAFFRSFVYDSSNLHQTIVSLDSLPASLQYIGSAAFLEDNDLIINNFDLPNLIYLGGWSFMHVTVKNITLGDFSRYGNLVTFLGSDLIETVTVDYDIFGQNYSYGGEGFSSMFGGYLSNYCARPGVTKEDSWGYSYYDYDNWEMIEIPKICDSQQHFKKIKFTANAATAPNSNPSGFMGIWADEIDLSETPWTRLYIQGAPISMFMGAKIGTLKLPSQLQYINSFAFHGADIETPLELPGTIKEIGDSAFDMNWRVSDDAYQGWAENVIARYNAAHPDEEPVEFEPGVIIANLPSSIEKIGNNAFYNSADITIDVDLPNLKELGSNAFSGSGIRNVYLHDGLESLGINAFYGAVNLNDITIDVDLYDEDIRLVNGCKGSYYVAGSQIPYNRCGEHFDDSLTDEENFNADFYDAFFATFGTPNHKYGTITFTENAGEPCGGFNNCSKERGYFYGIKADKVDLSATNWTATSASMFQDAEVGEILLPHALATINPWTFYNLNAAAKNANSGVEPVSIAIPATLKTISYEGFMRAQAEIDGLPEGLTTIINSAFYEADVTDDLVIPSTVTLIGSSAFNAGSEDVQYNTVTIKPNLTMNETAGQLIFQAFWNAKINDKLIISSNMLPALFLDNQGIDMTDQPEFHGMTMKEAIITNLPKITAQAFEECANLEKVDLSSDAALRAIDDKAFYNDTKLGTILFSPAIKNETVTVGPLAFKGTAFKTMGDSSKQFDLTAAKFDASEGYAFSEMPKLETVDIPRSFSNATVPAYTFYNDTELRIANIDYKVTLIDDGAFSEDNKLESIFIWGNTEIEDTVLAGHGASTDGENGVYATDQGRGADRGPTIPEPTDIYAYSTSPAEDYAALPVRGTFEGDFYPLDEVLYLTSNKPTVLVNDDATDFDKSDLIVYAMRRDGIILESDSWATYDGNAYQRATSDVDFEAMAAAIQENPVFASIHDTPVPMDELDVTTNVNFENIDFDMVPDPDNANIRKITLLYNDKYTDHLADTDILPYQEGDPVPPVVPDTGATKAWKSFMDAGLPIATIAMISLVGGVLIFKKRRG